MNNKTGVVILARLSSSRLPGKALLEIRGKKVIDYVVERVQNIIGKLNIILATSNEQSDDKLARHIEKQGIQVFRGSLDNVSRRFYEAARSMDWDYAIRINGDNIFLDNVLLTEILELTDKGKYDFISNVKGRTYPKGMSIESIRMSYYEKFLLEIETEQRFKEHVTLYFYENDEGRNHFYFCNREYPELAGIQLALDTQEDLERTEKLLATIDKPNTKCNLKEIYNIFKSNKNELHV